MLKDFKYGLTDVKTKSEALYAESQKEKTYQNDIECKGRNLEKAEVKPPIFWRQIFEKTANQILNPTMTRMKLKIS